MKTLFMLCISVFIATSGFAQSFYTETGTAVFHSKVPLHNFSGTSENLTGLINLEDKTVDFFVDLTTLDTGNGKRDKDMRLTLETETYPFGEFFGKLTSDFDSESAETQQVTVEGTFKIHGKEKDITVSGELTSQGETLVLKANWILNLSDYEIKPPKLLFVKVDEKQEIEINAVLTIKE